MTGWWLYFLTLLPLPPASVSLRGSAGLAASSLLPADTPQLSPTLCRAANLQQPAWDIRLTPRMWTRL